MKRLFGVFVISFFLLFTFCQKNENKPDADKTTPPSVILAYTSGTISSASEIKVLFNHDMVDSSEIGKPLDKSPISFNPQIKGSAFWQTGSSLIFKPEKRLPPGISIEATLANNQFAETINEKKNFVFSFSTIKQGYEISFGGLAAVENSDLTTQKYSGTVTTADIADDKDVEKIVTASQNGKKLPVKWWHNSNKTVHTFTIDNIKRSDTASSFELLWDGAPIGVDMNGTDNITVPSLSTFIVNSVKAVQGAEQYIEISFSDPLKKQQNLKGLITVGGNDNLQFSIAESIVKVYTKRYLSGQVPVIVNAGIKNSIDRSLKEGFTEILTIENIKPQVKFLTKGVIIPSTNGVTIPIETINLKAVIVEARHILNHNMTQFMQVNSLDGSNELRRVGKVVWKKRINLNFTPDKTNKWLRYGLDCEPLVKNFPGGMFRLRIYFLKNHAVYHCLDNETVSDTLELRELEIIDENLLSSQEKESSSWDSYEEGYNDDNYDESSFAERNDPCSNAYYKKYSDHNIELVRNILVSDIGIIAKCGKNDSLFVVLSNIKTVDPIEGAKVAIIDYQQDTITTGVTDKKGCISLYTKKKKPFMVLVRNGNQQGYLKINDGDALSVSQFDVSGDRFEKGLKGFIYGERGIWRPGDTLFLTFVLNDNNNPLPPKHPVILEVTNS
ncbi:MAG: hypothetical protein Q4F84_03830, partial [Fibrobacter sp.]|nr:hypothetical protein [Fibrobacter sp.]